LEGGLARESHPRDARFDPLKIGSALEGLRTQKNCTHDGVLTP